MIDDPSRPTRFPLSPRSSDGLLFVGAAHRYTYVSPLLDDAEDCNPVVIAQREPLDESEAPELVTLKHVVLGADRHRRAYEEVKLAMQLRHPAIARVYGLEEHAGEPFVVTHYSPGILLETAQEMVLLRGKKLSPLHAVYIAAEVADALHCAWHSRGEDGQALRVVHRALHPLNIRLEARGRVKLVDFGLAHAVMPGRLSTPPRSLRADLSHASPEVMSRGEVDGRADLYSLGMILLELVSGRYPLDPPDVNPPEVASPQAVQYDAEVRPERPTWTSAGVLAERILRFGPEEVERAARDVDEPLKRILHKALRARPDERYQSGGELREALCEWLRSQPRPRFGRAQASAELRALLRRMPSPQEARAFPLERGVLLMPEEEAPERKT